jgi:hypothetical protein
MPGDRFTLAEYPGDVIRLECAKCGRSGRLRKDRLIAEYGPDIVLPDLRMRLANCERAGSMHDPCGAIYPD